MRRFSILAAVAALIASEPSFAARMEMSLSTGCNTTSFTSNVNRSTSLLAEANRGRQLYTGSFDSHGVTSFGIGRIFLSSDFERAMYRYPLATVFVAPGWHAGLELKLHNEWHLPIPANRTPGKWLPTVFETEAGVLWRAGYPSKVRVTQRFVISQRRLAGRSQGAEWVWEYRPDFPEEQPQSGQGAVMINPNQQRIVQRVKMRFEQWAFFSREAGFGIIRFSFGATKRVVWRTEAIPPSWYARPDLPLPPARPRKATEAVGMLRIEYIIRRWFWS